MTDWPTIVGTVASLVAGGGIAIVGQSLSDRRTNRRERESRREDYKVNYFFTVQREALMKVQDIVASISSEISAEYIRQSQAAERAKFDPAAIDRQMAEIAAL